MWLSETVGLKFVGSGVLRIIVVRQGRAASSLARSTRLIAAESPNHLTRVQSVRKPPARLRPCFRIRCARWRQSRPVFADVAPVSVRKEVVVVSLLSIYAMSENWDHVFVSVSVEVMYFVALVEDVGHHVRWRRVDNGGRDDVRHVSGVFVLWYLELLVGVKLTYSTKMHVASKNCYTNGLRLCNVLQFFDEPIPFFFVVFGCPVIVEIVEDFNTAIEFVDEATKHASTSHSFDGVHHPACQDVF